MPDSVRGADSHLFLSPHLDDAVLSCGGTVSQLCRTSNSVVVYTLFAATASPPYTSLTNDLHQQWGCLVDAGAARREEDRMACSILCCRACHGELQESMYRRGRDGQWLYATNSSVFGVPHREDASLLHAVQERIRAVIPRSCRLYVPLALGGHVDHRLANSLGCALQDAGYTVWYYEDLPYATRGDVWAAHRPMLQTLDPVTVSLEPVDLMQKLRAAKAYRSQVDMLFGNRASMAKKLIAYAQLRSRNGQGFAEIFWRKVR